MKSEDGVNKQMNTNGRHHFLSSIARNLTPGFSLPEFYELSKPRANAMGGSKLSYGVHWTQGLRCVTDYPCS